MAANFLVRFFRSDVKRTLPRNIPLQVSLRKNLLPTYVGAYKGIYLVQVWAWSAPRLASIFAFHEYYHVYYGEGLTASAVK